MARGAVTDRQSIAFADPEIREQKSGIGEVVMLNSPGEFWGGEVINMAQQSSRTVVESSS
jgi:hypothetical protein